MQRETFMSLLNGMTSDMCNKGNYWLKHIGTLFEFTNGSFFGRTKSQRVCSRVSGSLKVNTLKVLFETLVEVSVLGILLQKPVKGKDGKVDFGLYLRKKTTSPLGL